jgi:Ca-activated chloride channel homolog
MRSILLALILTLSLLSQVAAQSHKDMNHDERKPNNPQAEAQPQAATVPVSAEPARDEKIKIGVDLVVLDAQVLDQKTSRIVGSLKKEDFTIFEDGVKQSITHFGQDTFPLSVILLVDRGGCLDPFGEKVRHATLEALKRLRPQDEIALMAFHDKVELVHGFGTPRDRIADSVARVPDHDEEAGHCFNRAFYEAARYMRKAGNPDGRRVIIMITAINRAFDCKGVTGEQARQEILESGSVVCGLVPKSAGQQMESGMMSGIANIGRLFKVKSSGLKELAEETGGEVMSDKPENIDSAFNNLVDHLRTRYSIGFVSSNTSRDGGFRKLKVELSKSVQLSGQKLVVKTRRGYLAAKAPADKVVTTGKP